MNCPYSISRLRISALISSRLLSVLWVIQAVATVAEPPTSDPSTAAIALTMAGSIAYSPLAIWLEPTEDTLTANTRRPRRPPDINQ